MRLTLRTLLAYLDNTLEPTDAELLNQKLEQSAFASQLVQRIRSSIANPHLSAPAPDSVHPIEEPNMMSNYLDSTLTPEQVAEIEKACLESAPHLAEAAACHQILTLVLGKPAAVTDQLRSRVVSMVDPDGKSRLSDRESKLMIAGEIGPRYSDINLPTSGDEALAGDSATEIESIDVDAGTIAANATSTDAAPPPVDDALADDALADNALADNALGTAFPGSDFHGERPEQVRPVGVDDSGVFQAATKLREQSQQFGGAGTALDGSNSIAGDRRLRALERSDFYEGEVRTSRITPWLVSLALVAALLFAVSQIFAPLLGPERVAETDRKITPAETDGQDTVASRDGVATAVPTDNEAASDQEASTVETAEPNETAAMVDPANGVPGAEQAGASKNSGDADIDPDLVKPSGADAMVDFPLPSQQPTLPESGTPESSAIDSDSRPAPQPVDAVDPDAPPIPPEMLADATPDGVNKSSQPATGDNASADADADADADAATKPAANIAALPKTETMENSEPGNRDAQMPAVEEIKKTPPPDEADSITPIATMVSENALVAQLESEDQWKLVAPQAELSADTQLVCAPEYRAAFAFAGGTDAAMTLVGPTEVRLLGGPNTADVRIGFGKGVIKLTDPGSSVSLTAQQSTLVARTESSGAVLAFDVIHDRDLGADPLVPQNHATKVQLIAVAGDFSIEGLQEPADLPQGSVLTADVTKAGQPTGQVAQPDTFAAWIDPEIDTGSLEAGAANALLQLVRGDDSESLSLSLRVALNFRRNEVAALAGKTMLALGDASAYFGVDGLLSDARQRLYWSSHLDSLRNMLARSVSDAAAVRTAIAGQNVAMDNADGDTLFRLLIGYSQDELKTGGDAELVADLESASMPVRVLASEHLRDISGTTLFFRPEEEVANRRDEVIKKWMARLRKGSIRYPESE